MTDVLQDLRQEHAEVWGSRTVVLQHDLTSAGLFTDEALAALLDDVDPRLLGIKTMGAHCPEPLSWYRCSRQGLSGADLLSAVAHGQLWLNLSAVHELDSRFRDILDSVYGELERGLPGFRTTRRRLGLLVSSPGAHVVYHADPLGQGLIQLRGRKRVWIYPPTAPFLRDIEIEDIVRGRREEDLSYRPWFDTYSEQHELEPGQLLFWALNSPHRVQNHDSMNVSLTTEHWSREVRRAYVMNYGNGVLRSLGISPRSRSVTGPAYWAKAAVTGVERLRRGSSDAAPGVPTFRVDPGSATGTSPL